MKFRLWLENIQIPDNQVSNDYHKTWYHGTMREQTIQGILNTGRLITRDEGARRTNAAALGNGIYLTNDPEEAQAYVGGGIPGAVFAVQVTATPKILRINNDPQHYALFDELHSMGLENPNNVNKLLTPHGYQGVHWTLQDGIEKLVVYDSQLLSPARMSHKYTPRPNSIDGDWTTL